MGGSCWLIFVLFCIKQQADLRWSFSCPSEDIVGDWFNKGAKEEHTCQSRVLLVQREKQGLDDGLAGESSL